MYRKRVVTQNKPNSNSTPNANPPPRRPPPPPRPAAGSSPGRAAAGSPGRATAGSSLARRGSAVGRLAPPRARLHLRHHPPSSSAGEARQGVAGASAAGRGGRRASGWRCRGGARRVAAELQQQGAQPVSRAPAAGRGETASGRACSGGGEAAGGGAPAAGICVLKREKTHICVLHCAPPILGSPFASSVGLCFLSLA